MDLDKVIDLINKQKEQSKNIVHLTKEEKKAENEAWWVHCKFCKKTFTTHRIKAGDKCSCQQGILVKGSYKKST